MAKAIGLTLVRKGLIKPNELSVSCPEENLLQPWKDAGCFTSFENGEIIQRSDTIIWAVKPQMFRTALKKTIYPKPIGGPRLHISVMAGMNVANFSQGIATKFGDTSNISTARVMPSISMMVDSGCAVYTFGTNVTEENKVLISKLFSSSGISFEVPEDQINAYCGLFSSGTAFLFPVIEAMADGAVRMGIPRDKSLQIAAQTVKGAAQLVLETHLHPGPLKDSICSPGGTTIAGIATLEEYRIRSAFIDAVTASTRRGDELSKTTKG